MSRISTAVLGIITAALIGMTIVPAVASTIDPTRQLVRVIVAERHDLGSGDPTHVIAYNPDGSVNWSTDLGPLIEGSQNGFSSATIVGDSVYVTDFEAGRLQEFSLATGAHTGTPIPSLSTPTGSSADSAGTLFISHEAGSKVGRWTTGGTALADPFILDGFGGNAAGVVVGGDGNLYMSTSGTGVRQYQGPNGASPGAIIDANWGSGLPTWADHPVWHNGDLYLSGSAQIWRIPGSGGAASVWSSGGPTSSPTSHIAQFGFAPDGYVYVASGVTGEVLRYDNDSGAYVDTFASGLDYAYGLTLEIIPEPSSVAMVALGILLVTATRRRKTLDG